MNNMNKKNNKNKMNKMRQAILLLMMMGHIAAMQAQNSVSSPDGRLTVTVYTEEGRAMYAVDYDGQRMVMPSRLGLTTDYADFTRGMTMGEMRMEDVRKQYDMTRTKRAHIAYEARRMDVALLNAKGQRMDVTFVVGNNDIGMRYTLYRQANDNPKSAVVKSEATSFRLPDGTTTFLSPQSKAMVGWERTKPSYEEVYGADEAMERPSAFGEGYVFPALFHVGDSGWVLVSETGVASGYVGSHLSDYDRETGYTIAYPMAGENNGNGTPWAGIALPGSTPWRTITVGRTLAPIVETTVAYDLVEPLYEAGGDYRPGRYTWSWLIGQDESITYDEQVRFIDLAAAMGFEYCLVDNWWDRNIGRTRMAQLARYAAGKGVGLLLWYNSNGYENDAPQTPRQCMNTATARDREMAWLKSIGVKGIKVDFFGGDKQQTMQLYEDILCDANRYGLQVVFHGCTLPRGWERMFPNFVSSEAVLASENVYFTEEHARREPFDLTLHPFCRNAVAAMDWGGIIMNRHMSADNRSRHTRKTTNTFEMASGITMQTAVQCVAMRPNNLQELSQVELDFLRTMPTAWDETRYIDGYPGRYVVLARRCGSRWYIAGLNAGQEERRLTLTLPMLKAGQTVGYYTDNKQGETELKPLRVDKRQQVKIVMQPNGGMVLISST